LEIEEGEYGREVRGRHIVSVNNPMMLNTDEHFLITNIHVRRAVNSFYAHH
jgi:hypothetical protein